MSETISNLETTSGGEMPLLAGRYRPVKALGQGGMGSVWLAEDTALADHKVALKMLPPILVSNRRALQQLKAEALVSLKLTHSNIATLRSFEENDGNPFLVMDFIDGQTLDDYLAEKETLDEEETLRILRPVAEALDYAHREKVVHRDVKPGNVMIRKDGTPFVLDFGIAREIQETLTRVTGKLSSGTLLYMSPEQLNGEAVTPAQDVYSFAATAYECLAGHPPFHQGQVEFQILTKEPPPLASGSAFARGVLRGLAKDPASRPSSCLGVLGADSVAPEKSAPANRPVPVESPQVDADIYLVEFEAKGIFESKVAAAQEPSDATLRGFFHKQHAFYSAATSALSHGDPVSARRLFADFTQSVADYEAAVAEPERKAEAERKAEEARQLELARQREEERKAEARRWSGVGAKAGDVQEMTLPGGVKMKFVWCPPGTFMMGSPAGFFKGERGRIDDEKQHQVTLTKVFWMGQFEVTQAQWKAVMGDNPSDFKGDDNRPVENVSWDDCQKFISKCKAQAEGVRFALPTEAQWEYACRAGATGPYAGTGNLDEMGWYAGNSDDTTHPVGQKRPNAWNLYDMHGNVWEWCADWEGAYAGDCTDPTGPASGFSRVIRGGGWGNIARGCRSAHRGRLQPSLRFYFLGFRLCCSAGPRE